MDKLTVAQQQRVYKRLHKLAMTFLDKMDAADDGIDESLATYYLEDRLRPMLGREAK